MSEPLKRIVVVAGGGNLTGKETERVVVSNAVEVTPSVAAWLQNDPSNVGTVASTGIVDSTAAGRAMLTAASHQAQADLLPIDKSVRRPSSVLYVFEGDSMTEPGGQGGSLIQAGEDYPAVLMTLSNFAGTGPYYNVAQGGQPITSLLAQYATQVYPYRPAAAGVDTSYLFVWTFNNDYDSRDEGAIWNDFVNYVTTAKNDGFTVVSFTVPKRRPPSGHLSAYQKPEHEVTRQNLNERLRRAYASGLIHMLIDVDRLFPGPHGSNTEYDSNLSIDGTHFTPLANRLLAQHINAIWPCKGQPIAFNQDSWRQRFIVAKEVIASGQNAGTTLSNTWNARTLNTLSVDTDDLARLCYVIYYSFTPGAASGLIVRQTIVGQTSGTAAFVVYQTENITNGTGQAVLVNVAGSEFIATETITTPSFSGVVTSFNTSPFGVLYVAPGRYMVEASAVAIMCGGTKLRLVRWDNANVLLAQGQVFYANTAADTYAGAVPTLSGMINLTSGTLLQLQHYTVTGQTSFGKGLNINDGTDNCFATLKLIKIN